MKTITYAGKDLYKYLNRFCDGSHCRIIFVGTYTTNFNESSNLVRSSLSQFESVTPLIVIVKINGLW